VGNLGKEVAGGRGVGGCPGYSEEVPIPPATEDAPETGPSTSGEQQAAGGKVLPVEDGPLSHWPIPEVDKE